MDRLGRKAADDESDRGLMTDRIDNGVTCEARETTLAVSVYQLTMSSDKKIRLKCDPSAPIHGSAIVPRQQANSGASLANSPTV